MLAHPKDCFGVAGMPRRALVHGKEAPWVFVIPDGTVSLVDVEWKLRACLLFGHKDPHSALLGRAPANILLPDDAQKERAGAVHDSDVGNAPITIVLLEALDDAQEEGMLGHRAHSVVRDARGDGSADPGTV
jgi:hypothetical protein